MNTAFLDSFFRPSSNGRGQRPNLASPPVWCIACREPLIEVDFSKGWELVCNNFHCHMFRQPQGYRSKE